MKVVIFTLFSSSILELITAPYPTSTYSYDSGRYPLPGGVRRNYSPPKLPSTSTQFSSRMSPISSSVPEFEQKDYSSNNDIQSPDIVKKFQTEFEPINIDIDKPILNKQTTIIDESSISTQSSPPRPRSRPSSLPSTGSSLSQRRTSQQVTANRGRPRSSANRELNSPNLNQNQKSKFQSKSNVQEMQPTQNPIKTNQSSKISTNRANKRFQKNNSSKKLPAVSARPNRSGSTSIKPVDSPQLQDFIKNKEIEPAGNEEKNPPENENFIENEKIEPAKNEEKNPIKNEEKPPTKNTIITTTIKTSEKTPETTNKPPEKSEPDDEWDGPKTIEEDKPELYTVDENVQFIRDFTSDMIIQGKYKVGETIMYLLKNKEKELDTADKAAIEYVINERLRKDPELIEALKKHNQKQKGGTQTSQLSNSNDEDMPPYMVQILSPSFSISQFETSPQIEKDSNPPPNNKQISNINTPPAPGMSHLIHEDLFFPLLLSRLQNLFQNDDSEDDADPFSSGISSFGGHTGTQTPSFSIFQLGTSPQIKNNSNPPIQSRFQNLFQNDDSEDDADPHSSGFSSFGGHTGIKSSTGTPSFSIFQLGTSPQIKNSSNPPIQSRFQNLFQNDDSEDDADPHSSGFSSFGGHTGIKSSTGTPSFSIFQLGTSPQIKNSSNPPIQSRLQHLFHNDDSEDDADPFSSGISTFGGHTGIKSQTGNPSFSILKFGTSPQIKNDSNPSPSNKQIFNINKPPATSSLSSKKSFFPSTQPRLQNLFQNDDNEDDADPYSSGTSNFEGDTGIQSPRSKKPWSPISVYNPTFNSNPNARRW